VRARGLGLKGPTRKGEDRGGELMWRGKKVTGTAPHKRVLLIRTR
jgi:hypothetical protein